MCEEFPGPRCSYDANKKLVARHRRVLDAQKKYGTDSPQAQLAAAKYQNAVNEYDATPKGIQSLAEELAANPENEELTRRLKVAEATRTLQTNALKEIRNGRVENIAVITSALKSFQDKEEAVSIIESSRESAEKYKLRGNPDNIKFSADEKGYVKFLDNLETSLNNKYGEGNIPPEYAEALTNLKESDAPDFVNMQAYTNLPTAFDRSRKQLISEIKNAAALQGVSPKIAAEYYEAYRKQYKDEFADLPSSERPDPPEHWIRGEFGQSGYAKDPNSNFAPHDAASAYAIYRLRADDAAIPDYMKHSRTIASIDLETAGPSGREGFEPEYGRIIEVGVKLYSPNGKEVGRMSQLIKPEQSFLDQYGTGAEHIHQISVKDLTDQPDWKSVSPQVSNTLRGKVMLAQNAPFERKWLSYHLTDFSKEMPIIDTLDMSRKHFDLPNHQLKTICENNGVAYTNGHRAFHDAEVTGAAYFKLKKNISKMWFNNSARKKAPVLQTIPSNSRWVAKKTV